MRRASERHSSLQRFLLTVVVVAVALPATITGFILIRENFGRTVDHDARITARNYIELLEAGATMPLWNIAPDLGRPLIDSVSIDPSVSEISILSADGQPFLSYRQPDTPQGDQISLHRDIVYEGELLGGVDLSYSLASARARAENESRLLLTIIITQLIFTIVVVSFFIQRRVIRPVKALEAAAAGIAEGDLKTSIPKLSNDEFGALSKQLEKMRGSIENSFFLLEERVRERTGDLVDLNKELKQTLEQLKQAQGNLVQSEKLAALGSLVAGISHELNTPIGNGLTVASSLHEESAAMLMHFEKGMTRSQLDIYLRDMNQGTQLVVSSLDRASELVSSFKQVAMDRTSAQRRQFDLLSMLNETKLTVSPAFKHTPYLIEIYSPADIVLDSFPGPLGQVITNLLNNALIHAFAGAERGTVTISAAVVEAGICRLVVEDDGCGIPEENLCRIFDPFFTTKLGEGGNGLGMHIVHNIVVGILGGSIRLESRLNKGTRFVIDIPLVAPQRSADGSLELTRGEGIQTIGVRASNE